MPPAGEISEGEGGSEGVDGGVEGKMFHQWEVSEGEGGCDVGGWRGRSLGVAFRILVILASC